MTSKIVVLDPISAETARRMRGLLPPGLVLEHAEGRDRAHLLAIVAEADVIISGQIPVDAELLRAAPRARLLHKWGVGVDNFDLEAARAQGVTVARTTGSNAMPVAEFTLGLMIALLRNLAWGHCSLRGGEWRNTTMPKPSFMLSGKTVGIIGFGAIGKNVARLLAPFGGMILYNKTSRLDPAEEKALGVRHATVPELLREADVVSLHCPLTPQTQNLIDRAALQSMKRSAVLINVARGGVVNEQDLAEALRAREILGAATDVYETEPPPAGHPLLALDNVVATPHIAAMAADNFEKTINQMFRNVALFVRGEGVPPSDFVG
ncbi:3-phosphoglycerate dehydrogenase [Roseomonas sp. M0104]|uniref:3-phosphoglycerate dehydrogenase n=1 Tax=Teichococcus coralli TaxID=2545983 RepID=A0A845BH11_9PROT|nr:2-hydroxyacid dehydrogenase [Pseudoroseomonas coralli]MXP64617.1 3-phosphoglycerate dehydrogenase [Pseudoroseomonas coralli]